MQDYGKINTVECRPHNLTIAKIRYNIYMSVISRNNYESEIL
jgi:hypothetical protein